MIRRTNVTAVSRRGGRGQREPLRHAVHRSLAGVRRGRSTFDARCGAQVAIVVDEEGFDTDHPRACPRCKKELT